MRKWLKGNVGWMVTALLTLLVLCGGGLVTWGRIQSSTETMYTAISGKADKESVTRELDLVQTTLDRIEKKIDQHMQK